MPAPINTYNSKTNLNLGQVPQVEDQEVYRALLDIHNALEILITSSDDTDASFLTFLTKFRSVSVASENYVVLKLDGTVLVDDTLADVTITLPEVSEVLGFRYDIKKISSGTGHVVNLIGAIFEGNEQPIDGRLGGIRISSLSSYTVKANPDGWSII
jgi:hypothetical protein